MRVLVLRVGAFYGYDLICRVVHEPDRADNQGGQKADVEVERGENTQSGKKKTGGVGGAKRCIGAFPDDELLSVAGRGQQLLRIMDIEGGDLFSGLCYVKGVHTFLSDNDPLNINTEK